MSAIASDLPLAFPTCIREMLIFSRPRMYNQPAELLMKTRTSLIVNSKASKKSNQ